jgi:hypothetical protein
VQRKSSPTGDGAALLLVAGTGRGGRWQHDSEVNAFIFDDVNPSAGAPTFAQDLRKRLWAEHLNAPPSSFTDGVASGALWLSPPSGAKVMLYNPTAGSDVFPDIVCDNSRDTIDPFAP